MVRDTIQLKTAVSTISQEYLLEFTSEYGITEDLHLELPGPGDRIVDFLEGKVGVYTKFFEFANFRIPISQFLFDILGHYQIHLSQLSVIGATKDEMPVEGSYSVEDVAILNTQRTPIQKQPEPLLCLVGLSRRYFLGDDVYPTFLNDDDRDMDLFNLIRALNPTKVKIGTRPRAAHEVPLLTVIMSRVIEMEEPVAATESSGTPSTIERSPLDFANENLSQQITGDDRTEDQVQGIVVSEVPPPENVTTIGVAPETDLGEEVAAMGPRVSKKCRKRRNGRADADAPPKVLKKDHAASRPTQSTAGGKSFASVRLEMRSTFPVPAPQEIPADASDQDPLSYANPQYSKGVAVAGDPKSENTSFTSMVGSPGNIYQPGWDVTNGCRIDTPKACQDLVDHLAPPGYFSEPHHLPNDDFMGQYNMNLARQVAMGSQLWLRIQARENEIKNLEALLEAEADMKKSVEAKNAELVKELESLHAQFTDLQVSNDRLSQQVVEKRCAEIDARLDALSIDFDEELYPHMLTAIAGRRWVIGHGLRLAVMKCAESVELRQAFADVVSAEITKGMSEGLKHGVEHGNASLDLEVIEAYDPEVDTKYVAALHALRDLKYFMVDQLESLKGAPIDVIMASLHLESDSGEDALQWIRELRANSSQLKIPVYPEVHDPKNPWSFKEEIPLEDATAANVSRAEKKKKCRVVCRTHGVSSAHHARSDGVPVSVPTVPPQGLAILLADAATQTKNSEDEASPRLFRSKS
ncbi:hypothetical protein Tco_1563805 [Tanacetum coccineum]